VCRAWLSAGVRLMQLRAKTLASGPFLELADELAALCHEAGALLIINDRADIAAMSGADGVHVGQEDLTPTDARGVVGSAAMVGLSTHDHHQVASGLREPVSYLAFGPIYTTNTKVTGYDAAGHARLREAATVAARADLPLVAIGGITIDRAAGVREAGADSVAVIADLLAASDLSGVETRAQAWLSRLT
jgi:thiamine-phosphate pyrophosphorylase